MLKNKKSYTAISRRFISLIVIKRHQKTKHHSFAKCVRPHLQTHLHSKRTKKLTICHNNYVDSFVCTVSQRNFLHTNSTAPNTTAQHIHLYLFQRQFRLNFCRITKKVRWLIYENTIPISFRWLEFYFYSFQFKINEKNSWIGQKSNGRIWYVYNANMSSKESTA